MLKKNDIFHQLIYEISQGKDIFFLVRQLAQSLERPIVITNTVHRVIVFHNPLDNHALQLDEFFRVPASNLDQIDFYDDGEAFIHRTEKTIKGKSLACTYVPLISENNCLGYFIVLDKVREKGLSKEEEIYIQKSIIPLILSLRVSLDDEKKQMEYRDEFIRDVLYNNYDSKVAIYDHTRPWGWDLEGSLLALIIDVPKGRLKIARELIPRLFNSRPPISAYINRQLVIVLNITGLNKITLKKYLDDFIKDYMNLFSLHNEDLSEFGVGVGTGVPSVIDLYKSYQEAKVAWELGRIFEQDPICYFEEMGFLKFIFTQPALELEEFCNRILGPLIEHDTITGGELLETLKVFIDNRCQAAKSAEALFIHENTMYNRVRKIEELIGFDLRRVDHIVNVYIALQVLNLGIQP